MKKRYILLTIFALFVIWILTGGHYTETENKPIKKITKTTRLYLLGKRNIRTLEKQVEYYNQAGQLTRHDYYDRQESVDSRYEYTYYPFDSMHKIIWMTGNDLTTQKITEHKYDSLKRLIEVTESSVNKRTNDTSLYDIDRYYYDSLGRNYRSIMKHFSTPDTLTSIFIKTYNNKGKVTKKVHYTKTNQHDRDKYVTTYHYDDRGFLKAEFGGLSDDSTYYKTNDKGQIIEEYEKYARYPDFITDNDKYWYDEKGNKTKTILDIDEGKTYDFIYDKYSRLLIEYRPWNFGILRGGVKYDYEYYDK